MSTGRVGAHSHLVRDFRAMSRSVLAFVVLSACAPVVVQTTSTSAGVSSTSVEEGTSTTSAPTTLVVSTTTAPSYFDPGALAIEAFPVPPGSRPHDVAPAIDGGVWYTAQGSGELGWLNPATGEVRHIPLGAGARPHGVIVDEEGTPWVTDGGLNAIVSVDPTTEEVTVYPLPVSSANLNTAVFDEQGILWFTGQNGIYGSLNPLTGDVEVFDAPGGRGPYGITSTPNGTIFYASLAGSYVGVLDDDGAVTVLQPPTPGQGARRVWADSGGSVWVSEWNGGNVSRYDPNAGEWETWRLPGDDPAAYAVYVDETDIVWLSDFGSNSIVRFDPATQVFHAYPLPHQPGNVRQIHGRPGEVWGAESAADHLILIRTR
ncbi:MAG: lyase [Acidimicrobiia bacterium]|nr:lyase [Acidimicrobiia bacterium]